MNIDERLGGVTLQEKPADRVSGFRKNSTLGLAVTAVALLTPFAVNNLLQGRQVLGLGSLVIVGILAANAWSIARGRYYPLLTLLGLVPASLFFLALSLRTQGIVGALWCYPAVLAYYFMLPERQAWVANAALLGLALPLAANAFEAALAARVGATLLAVSTFSAIFLRVITDQQQTLHEQAVTDPLTGLANRTLLAAALEQATGQYRRTRAAMTLVALDLDHFKAINDTLGHDAGDVVLRSVGALLRRRIRRGDQAFRLGGEEFLVLLYGTDADNGRQVAEQLREAVGALEILPDRTVTVSAGVASLQPDEDWRAWIRRSDANLYRAKAAGRNCVAG